MPNLPAANRPNLSADRLHLGCGLTAPADWLNVDGSFQAVFARRPRLKNLLVALGIYPRSQAAIAWPTNILRLDLRQPLPFENERFGAIYCSHTFEHLYRQDALALARECLRVLRPGGVCRIVVPDLAAAVERYLQRHETPGDGLSGDLFMDELLVHPRAPVAGMLGLYHRLLGFHQHKWMYDARSLSSLLAEAGFSEPVPCDSMRGELPGLADIEDPGRIENGAGVAVEGHKPL
jgi:SAM-dependent methyltransferase